MKGYTYICNMKRYRIKQISDNLFIPQFQEGFFDWIANDWNGIEHSEDGIQTYFAEHIQVAYCTVPTLEQAKLIIELHKQSTIYPKYHKA